jgi:hypothetical protein
MRGSIIGPLNIPKGRFLEGIIDDASLPGTWMEVTPGSTDVSGRPHYRHYGSAGGVDGMPREMVLLLEDPNQGMIATKAYVPGTRGQLYAPLSGEEFNVLTAPATGTGSLNVFKVGTRLKGQAATGQFIIDAVSADTCPFVVRELITQTPPDTATLVFVEYTGGGN